MKKYVLNTATGTLHIQDYCVQTKRYLSHTATFDTEQEAFEYAGKHIKLCKICERKKEQIIKQSN